MVASMQVWEESMVAVSMKAEEAALNRSLEEHLQAAAAGNRWEKV